MGLSTFGLVKAATAAPEAVVHEFLSQAKAGDFAAAWGHFSVPLQEAQPQEQFSTAAAAHRAVRRRRHTFNDRSVDLRARLRERRSSPGTEVPVSFELVRERRCLEP